MITHHYRYKFRLHGVGTIQCYATACLVPAALSFLLFESIISRDIQLARVRCPSCQQIRAAGCQAFSGFIQPFIIGMILPSMFARSSYTYDIPSVRQPSVLMKFYGKVTQPLGLTLATLLGMNMLTAMTLTHARIKASIKLFEAMEMRDGSTVDKETFSSHDTQL